MYSLVAKLIGSELHRTKSNDDSNPTSEDETTCLVDQSEPNERRDDANNNAARCSQDRNRIMHLSRRDDSRLSVAQRALRANTSSCSSPLEKERP